VRYLAALFLCLGVAGASGPAHAARQSASTCAFTLPGHVAEGGPAMLTTELPDGALVIGTWRLTSSTITVSLSRVNPGCQSYRLAPITVHVRKFGTIDSLVATPQAELLLGGSDGRDAIVGRFLATGRPDRSFGSGGWIRLRPREKPEGLPLAFEATSIAVARSGAIFVGGNDGGAHCCTRDFVTELLPSGRPVRTLFIPSFGGSYTTDVHAYARDSVYVLGEYEQSGCGGPSIVRIQPNGAVDKSFDATMRRTLGMVAAPKSHLRFTPTLVPVGAGGAFLLVGGLDRTCVAAQRAKLASGGIAVPINASGQMSRKPTRFDSPDYAFDSPTAIALPSGKVYAAAVAYTPNGGKVASILVQAFDPGGFLADRHAFRPPGKTRPAYASVALLPGSGEDVWLVVGEKQGIFGSSFR
jgi:hypothetical protein